MAKGQSANSEVKAPKSETVARAKKASEKAKREPGTYVAEGCSVTTKGRIYGPGKLIKPDMCPGGQKALDHLVDRGTCEKVK